MAKRGVFFQFYLNPRHKEDQEIITWLQVIPRSRRSQKIREILLGAIRGHVQQHTEAMATESRQEASGLAKNFLSTLSKKRAS